jgi:FkbM family methyltransferase
MSLTLEKTYAIVRNVTPPFIFNSLRKGPLYTFARKIARKNLKLQYTASWNKIQKGSLVGVELYVDPKGEWQQQMLSGEYDDYFSRYLDALDTKGKVIYDIGAHIGYSALFFAEKVGPTGHVITFEPNPFNVERIKLIFGKNKELASRIEIAEVAVSDKNGEDTFVFSSYLDNGTSSGSFIESAHTIYPQEGYHNDLGFKSMKVKTVALDMPTDIFRAKKDPDIIKLDIEGAEFLALRGMIKTIERSKPIVLVEVHSIYNMYILGEIFKELGYVLELLKEETDGRCFFAAKYKSK